MSEELNKEIKDSIDANLPAMVGEQLKARLVEAGLDVKRLSALKKEFEDYKREHTALVTRENRVKDDLVRVDARQVELNAKATELDKRERALAIKEATIELREFHATEKVGLLRGVVGDVFANNRFKYERATEKHLVVPGQEGQSQIMDSNGMVMQYAQPHTDPHVARVDDVERVEGEGDIPPGAV